MKLPVYNCLIDENPDEESGIYAISFVAEPANETDFVALSKEHRREHLSMDRSKQVLTGVVLRPDQLIYRSSDQLGEHYIRFSAEQIEKISHKMMRKHIALDHTTHQHQHPLEGNYLIELWIVEDPENDKSAALGFRGLPKGTLMCSYKIEDKKYWDTQVMTGNIKGFSLEGFFFQQEMKKHSKSNINKQMNMNKKDKSTLLGKIAKFFLDIDAVQDSDVSGSGKAYVIFTLADGKEVFVDADGFATLDGEQMHAGEHLLADGNLLEVDNEGQFTGTKEPSAKSKNPEQAAAPQAMAAKVRRMLSDKNNTPGGQPQTDVPANGESGAGSTLEEKIAEMENKLAEMEQQLNELAGKNIEEVETLHRQMPGAFPLTQAHRNRKLTSEMMHTERMALSLAAQIQRKK
ncbi:MAG TPA: hypothetical protein DIT04_02030 [Dysgonomonas sp.]|nr:hypothetical protein [Dysgonomonas sp.]